MLKIVWNELNLKVWVTMTLHHKLIDVIKIQIGPVRDSVSQYRDQVMGWMTIDQFPAGGRAFFLFVTVPRPALEPTQPTVHWVLGLLPWR
jgi:hypothetical protein